MTGDPDRWIWAGAAVAAWLLLCLGLAWARRRTARREDARALSVLGDPGDDPVLIAFASQTGQAEALAWMTARAFADAGQGVRVVSFADLDLPSTTAARRALFVVATTGEGDPPDSAARMLRTVLEQNPDLSGLSYAVLALGDRSYKAFCGFGHAVERWLRQSGATPLFDTVEVDDADPAAIRHWQHQLNALTGSNAAPDWSQPAYGRWRLVERIHMNPGSPGGEAYHLGLEPIDAALDWSPGDIAEIGVPAPEGEPMPGARDFSIASLPADGRLELLVRLMRCPDGTPGLASGWLTQAAVIGEEIALRIRVNRGFHGPDAATPMILIGNGTGLAGLRAHLKARAGGAGGTWLLFGERTRAHDAFHDAELQAALASGVLTRLDRAFSRDAGDGRYVQALVEEDAAEVAAWVARGAAIYVCGSLEGMASGVHVALQTAIGAETLTALAETGRYRRDVY